MHCTSLYLFGVEHAINTAKENMDILPKKNFLLFKFIASNFNCNYYIKMKANIRFKMELMYR